MHIHYTHCVPKCQNKIKIEMEMKIIPLQKKKKCPPSLTSSQQPNKDSEGKIKLTRVGVGNFFARHEGRPSCENQRSTSVSIYHGRESSMTNSIDNYSSREQSAENHQRSLQKISVLAKISIRDSSARINSSENRSRISDLRISARDSSPRISIDIHQRESALRFIGENQQ